MGKRVKFDERWENEVLAQHMWWTEYGGSIPPGQLPDKYRDAHLAILKGQQEKREKERKKAEREANG